MVYLRCAVGSTDGHGRNTDYVGGCSCSIYVPLASSELVRRRERFAAGAGDDPEIDVGVDVVIAAVVAAIHDAAVVLAAGRPEAAAVAPQRRLDPWVRYAQQYVDGENGGKQRPQSEVRAEGSPEGRLLGG